LIWLVVRELELLKLLGSVLKRVKRSISLLVRLEMSLLLLQIKRRDLISHTEIQSSRESWRIVLVEIVRRR
jgi:hypothetical protein